MSIQHRNLSRRTVLSGLLMTAAVLGGCGYDGWRLWHPCPPGPTPDAIRDDPLVKRAFDGLDFQQVRDVHVHLIGTGDGGSGIRVHPDMRSPWHPLRMMAFKSYLNAACLEENGAVDAGYVQQLFRLANDFPPGFKLMLLAFDWFHDEKGRVVENLSPFHTPNRYAETVARRHPDRFEWIASVHPYRADALETLEWAAANGAKAVKWLPQAMGMDPWSDRCIPFYKTLERLKMPLLCHAGEEKAAPGGGAQELANPLRLRKAMEHGVRVIVAHAASAGRHIDRDRGENGPEVPGYELFFRLIRENHYPGLLYGDISAIVLRNRERPLFKKILEQPPEQLLYGSDFPLPGIIPIIRPGRFVDWELITPTEAETLTRIRHYNPILFDFVLKRSLRHDGKRFADVVFENRRVFQL